MGIIADNLHPKVLKNKLFINAVDYLIAEKVVDDQKGVSERTGITEAALSNIRNDKKVVSDRTIRKLLEGFPYTFNPGYFKGEQIYMTIKESVEAKVVDEEPRREGTIQQQLEVPEYVKRLFDEAVRMSTRNELLERQCESLIAELRDTKSKNENFLSELRKSKEDNDALAAELRISREQNKALISELRETRNENRALTERLEEAIDNIEGMKNQIAMMAGAYNTAQQPTFAPSLVNDKVFPEGFIRGGHTAITEEIIRKAAEILQNKSKRK